VHAIAKPNAAKSPAGSVHGVARAAAAPERVAQRRYPAAFYTNFSQLSELIIVKNKNAQESCKKFNVISAEYSARDHEVSFHGICRTNKILCRPIPGGAGTGGEAPLFCSIFYLFFPAF